MSLSEQARERLTDVRELEPTSNSELKDRWGMDSGSEVAEFLHNELGEHVYRDDESRIRTNGAAAGDGDADVPSDDAELGDPSTEEQRDDLLTPEEAGSMVDEARKEAYEMGRRDGYEEGVDEGYGAGYEDAAQQLVPSPCGCEKIIDESQWPERQLLKCDDCGELIRVNA